MQTKFSKKPLTQTNTACCILWVTTSGKLLSHATSKPTLANLKQLKANNLLPKSTGEIAILPTLEGYVARQIWLVNVGDSKKLSLSTLRLLANNIGTRLQTANITQCNLSFDDITVNETKQPIQLFVETLVNAQYQFNDFKSDATPKTALLTLTLHHINKLSATDKDDAERGCTIAHAIAIARRLGDTPPNVCTPSYLADYAKNQVKKLGAKCKTTVLGEAQLKKLKMNSLLSVGQGSSQESKLIIMEYQGGKKTDQPVVFVGKGVTFDTGGISLKGRLNMDAMKMDMCGAAALIGTFNAVVELKLKINLIVVIASVENMPDGSAVKPGDVVTTLSGQTVEILNTDAEGRLILCDALTYSERFKPHCVIDVATLTGAIITALGHAYSGLFSSDEKLCAKLTTAGLRADDPVWRLPIDRYDELLKSPTADFANINRKPVCGSIEAACFLSKFTLHYPWAHLDVAGTALSSTATGRPVSLLVEFCRQHAQEST